MRKLPASVRQQLAAQQKPAGDHPDANLLGAFSGRNLSPREHATIVTHLAECPECREVLALSFQVDASPAAASTAATKRRATWWGWRLAASAAVVCALIVMVWRPSRFTSSPPAKLSAKAIPKSKPSALPAPLITKAIEPQLANARKVAVRQKQAALSRELEEVPPAVLPAPSAPASEKAGQFLADVPPPQIQVQAPPPDAAAVVLAQSTRPAPAPPPNPVVLPNSVILPNSVFSAAGRAARFGSLLAAPRLHNKAVWSIAVSPQVGTVQKSEDGGKTWRAIPVDEATPFYALSATGLNVWVGGAEGKLFRSVDDGLHWVPVSVANEDAPLTGAVVAIDAHGTRITLKTDSGATWSSNDGGAHWRRE